MNQTFAILYVVEILALLLTEIAGVIRRNKHAEDGDTITEGWHWIDRWLGRGVSVAQWFWRVFTVGMLGWTILHWKTGNW